MSISRSPGDIVFVIAYLITAGFAFWTYLRERKRANLRSYATLWAVIAVVLCLLAFQSSTRGLNLLTDVFRQAAIHQGWYGGRRALQKILVACAVICTVPILFGFLFLFRRVWKQYLPAALALFSLLLYGVIQGISFHAIDYRMHAKYAGLQGKTWCQVVCLVLVAAALYWSSRRQHLTAAVSEEPTPAPTVLAIASPVPAASQARRQLILGACILLAVTMFASAHQRLVGFGWLYIGLPAAVANAILLLTALRKSLWPRQPFARLPGPIWLLLLPYLVFAVQSIVYRLMLHVSFMPQAAALLVYAICFYTVVQIASTSEWRTLFRVLGATGILFCIEGLGQFLTRVRTVGDIIHALPFGNGLADNDAGHLVRVVLPFWYWNGTAQLLVAFTALCLGLTVVSVGSQKRIWQAAICLHVLCILLSASRWGCACLLPLFGLFVVRHHRAARTLAAGVLGVMGIWLVRWTLINFRDITRISGSLRFRFRRWVWCLDAVKRNPLFGGNAITWADFTRRPIGVDGLYFWMLGIGGWWTVGMLLLLVTSHGWFLARLLRLQLPMDLREMLFAIALGIGCLLVGGILETVLADPVFILLFTVLSGFLIGSQRQAMALHIAD